MSREKRAKWLDEEARIKAEKGFSIDEEMIRSGASALRKLDELERWVDDQTTGFALLSPSSSFSQKQAGRNDGLREVLMYIRGQHPMQMPPEEETNG